uniref:DUF659 domain-containing protein n=1 Tax=Timema douglasi TaxID=61478 RepID=A0A7R8Z8M4_TIMDO|nr:unnamed protein product [Timema douglasi]
MRIELEDIPARGHTTSVYYVNEVLVEGVFSVKVGVRYKLIIVPSLAANTNLGPHVAQEIKEGIGDSYFWASVDETADRCARYIANIVVGKLDSTGPSSPHLIASRVLEVANSSTIATVVRDSLLTGVLWPSENNDGKFMVLLTDSAAYMLKAGASLKVFYPKPIHITCLAHGVHRVAENIHAQFPNMNDVIQTFDEEADVSIREAKVATSSSTNLAYVKSYFSNLPGVIVSLEARDVPLI